MSTFVHVPSTTITGPLEPNGQRPGADSGDPQLGILRFDTADAWRLSTRFPFGGREYPGLNGRGDAK